MKKYQSNKRNPNPPWPTEQPVVMIPPGESAGAVGMNGQRVYSMQNDVAASANISENGERMNGGENYPIMGEVQRPTDRILQNRATNGIMPVQNNRMNQWQNMSNVTLQNGSCPDAYITGYLCGHTGKYIRMEFLFGEQTHVDKTGILREVGNNYVVMQEMGTDNMIVCPLNKIKFINIYNVNNTER